MAMSNKSFAGLILGVATLFSPFAYMSMKEDNKERAAAQNTAVSDSTHATLAVIDSAAKTHSTVSNDPKH